MKKNFILITIATLCMCLCFSCKEKAPKDEVKQQEVKQTPLYYYQCSRCGTTLTAPSKPSNGVCTVGPRNRFEETAMMAAKAAGQEGLGHEWKNIGRAN